MSSRKILVLFFHPRFEDSKANKVLVEAIPQHPSITFRHVYDRYPEFDIDVHVAPMAIESFNPFRVGFEIEILRPRSGQTLQ